MSAENKKIKQIKESRVSDTAQKKILKTLLEQYLRIQTKENTVP